MSAINLAETNLFAYCSNNPVSNHDPDGNRWISLAIQRLIHNMVAKSVAKTIGGKENVYVRKQTLEGVKRGFLDVYDSKSRTYYEVKSSTTANTKRTIQQMEKYDGAMVASSGQGPISRGTEQVSGAFSFLYYDVTYGSVAPGLVTYNVHENPQKKLAYETVAATALTVVMVMAGITGVPVPA